MPLSRVRLLYNVRSALSFDGIDDYVAIADSPELKGMDELTIEIWLRTAKKGPTLTKSWGKEYSVEVADNRLKFRCIDALGNVSELYSNSVITDNNWHAVFCIWRTISGGKRAEIYIDNVLDNSVDRAGFVNIGSSAEEIDIAHMEEWGGPYLECKIAIVRMYNRALSSSEIQRNYQRRDDPVRSGLVLWLHNTSIEDTIWRDLSDYGNDGTIYGATKEDFLYTPIRIQDSVREQTVIR